MTEVIIKDDVLRKAAGEGMDAFVGAFVTAIKEAIGSLHLQESVGESPEAMGIARPVEAYL